MLTFERNGWEVTGNTFWGACLEFFDSLLRGIGQVMFQNNSYTGLLFLLGIACNSWLFAAAALVGAASSTAAAVALGAPREQVRSGMFGFNGVLVAIALLYFLTPSPLTWSCVVVAAAGSSVLMAALMELFKRWQLPVLTAPFVLTSLGFFLATARFGRLQSTQMLPTAGLPKSTLVEGVVTQTTVWEGTLNGVAQVFFQGSLLTGALFCAGLLLSSRSSAVLALFGALIGVVVAWGMGAAEPAIRAGAFGFNSALTMLAVGGVFLHTSRRSVFYAAFAAALAAVVHAALSAALAPLGMPAMTSAFVVVTWIFVLAARGFSGLRPSA